MGPQGPIFRLMGFSLAGWRSSDEAEFDSLVRPHIPVLYSTLRRLSGSGEDAEDILQDVLIKLYPKVSELRALDEPRPWLMRVAYRQFVDFHRRQRHVPTASQRYDDPQMENPGEELVVAGPEHELSARERARTVQAAVAELDPDRRAIVVLHLIEGFTLEEVSAALAIPVGTIKSRLHRIKAQLKRRLGLEPFGYKLRVNK